MPCTVVVVGLQYLRDVSSQEAVMRRVDLITDQMERIPEAVFVFLTDEEYPQSIYRKGVRDSSSPAMVISEGVLTFISYFPQVFIHPTKKTYKYI